MTNRNVVHATFTLERRYGCAPDRVFSAWAEPETKARWFANGEPSYQLDFRVGGIERSTAIHEGKDITWEALYREIVPAGRIVYTAVLYEGDVVATVSQATVELVAGNGGTTLVLTEQATISMATSCPSGESRARRMARCPGTLSSRPRRPNAPMSTAVSGLRAEFETRSRSRGTIDDSRTWYERLLGRIPDNRPMDTLAEWRITETGWLQITTDADRAGTALLSMAVDNLDVHLEGLRSRNLTSGATQDVNKGVQLSSVTDPDGNTVTFIGKFRINY